jgi:hypothetical protein
MIRLKNKEELINSALMICLIFECEEEATHLFGTESDIIDVCESHKNQLINQSFVS